MAVLAVENLDSDSDVPWVNPRMSNGGIKDIPIYSKAPAPQPIAPVQEAAAPAPSRWTVFSEGLGSFDYLREPFVDPESGRVDSYLSIGACLMTWLYQNNKQFLRSVGIEPDLLAFDQTTESENGAVTILSVGFNPIEDWVSKGGKFYIANLSGTMLFAIRAIGPDKRTNICVADGNVPSDNGGPFGVLTAIARVAVAYVTGGWSEAAISTADAVTEDDANAWRTAIAKTAVAVIKSGALGTDAPQIADSVEDPISVYSMDGDFVEIIHDVDVLPIDTIEELPEVAPIPDITPADVMSEPLPAAAPIFEYPPEISSLAPPIAEPAQLADTIIPIDAAPVEGTPMFGFIGDFDSEDVFADVQDDFFDPKSFTSGESILVSSDAQNVDFGFNGVATVPAAPGDFGAVEETYDQVVTVNATPETDVNEFGSVNYGFDPNSAKEWATNKAATVAASKLASAAKTPNASTQTVKSTQGTPDLIASLKALWQPVATIAKEKTAATTGQLTTAPKPQDTNKKSSVAVGVGLAAALALILR